MYQPRSTGGRGGARGGASGPRAGSVAAGTGRRIGSRAPARPASARRTAGSGGGAAPRTRAPQLRRYSGRATVLGVLMLGLLLAYAYPVRVYMGQQAQITMLLERQDKQRKTIESLTERRAKWDDPAYVASQARRRLQYTLVGEATYVVIGGAPGPAGDADPGSGSQQAPRKAWYGKLWSSVEAADHR